MTGGRRTGEDIQLDFICCSDPRVRQLEERLLMGSALLLQRDECSKAIRKWFENGEKRVSKLVFQWSTVSWLRRNASSISTGSRYVLPKTPYRRLRRHISHTIEGT